MIAGAAGGVLYTTRTIVTAETNATVSHRETMNELCGSNHYRPDALESYAPKSPSPRRVSPTRLISPRATPSENGFPEKPRTPPPPSGLPPPVPSDSVVLPKRPSTPVKPSSPRPIPPALPRKESEIRAAAAPEQTQRVSESKPVVARKPKRKPVYRTREDEQAAYGRIFVGCGQQSDYAILTKLGEGTFGYVLVSMAYPCESG